MKKALYTFLLWDLFLFATGLNDLVFYRNVTLSESATVVDWAQPAFASVTFISDFAFNLLWIAPTPLWEEFLFEVGS